MIIRYQNTDRPGVANEKGEGEHQDKDSECRCNETSRMSPRELLRLMIDDLAFWKKNKK